MVVVEGVNLRSSFPLALVGADVVETTEDLEGGVALNTVGLAEIGLLCAVDLDELDALLLQCSGSLLVLGGERLAVTTPWCEEFDKDERLRGDGRLKVGSGEAQNVGVAIGKDV